MSTLYRHTRTKQITITPKSARYLWAAPKCFVLFIRCRPDRPAAPCSRIGTQQAPTPTRPYISGTGIQQPHPAAVQASKLQSTRCHRYGSGIYLWQRHLQLPAPAPRLQSANRQLFLYSKNPNYRFVQKSQETKLLKLAFDLKGLEMRAKKLLESCGQPNHSYSIYHTIRFCDLPERMGHYHLERTP